METLYSNKYNDIIVNAVHNCTDEIISLMEKRGLYQIDFRKHDGDPVYSIFEDTSTAISKYWCEEVISIHIDENKNLIVTGESGITGYVDNMWGDYFTVADTMPKIYEKVIDIFNKINKKEDFFHNDEYEEKYSHGVTKDMWNTIIILLELTPEEEQNIKSMKITESDDKFDYIYIDFGGKFSLNGANYCAIRDRKNDDIYIPTSAQGTYPASLTEASMYAWVNQEHEKIMLNSNNEMENYDELTRKRLEYLNGEGNARVGFVFDGIKFIWHKNHTICVKSQKDIREGNDDISYVAIYNRKSDIVPIKFYRQQLITKL